ncbi:L-alanine exporter AlaE [Acerihabitans arboris]|uniref:L-alanine exporter AlaE n=1 Tax=Acerihabitans arboris TaxID=2691583 RepID=A0A845SF20_9GAMM|nr:L-alanine exporter AlaE [Acerihabitans arboris]NDL61298.1 L-alanine exporter AlaE [Acerihabitans arboris]
MFSRSSRLRMAAADTFALVVYCFIAGMVIEILLSGMTLQQSLSSRLLSVPVNIVIAWPFGQYRDAVLKLARRHGPDQFWARNIADLLAYVSFQSPVYVLILLAVGADSQQIMTAVTSNAVGSMILGVAYGYFLEYCRRLFHVTGYVN